MSSSLNRLKRKSSTSSSFSGPPRFKNKIPTLSPGRMPVARIGLVAVEPPATGPPKIFDMSICIRGPVATLPGANTERKHDATQDKATLAAAHAGSMHTLPAPGARSHGHCAAEPVRTHRASGMECRAYITARERHRKSNMQRRACVHSHADGCGPAGTTALHTALETERGQHTPSLRAHAGRERSFRAQAHRRRRLEGARRRYTCQQCGAPRVHYAPAQTTPSVCGARA